jgi:tetratricopeptide (TPR) repeat protein
LRIDRIVVILSIDALQYAAVHDLYSPPGLTMMENKDFAARIGSAWIAFRAGQFDAAANAFEAIAAEDSSSIDAQFGLGLVRRAQNNRGTAIAHFQQARTLIARALAENPGSDRYEILQRMVEQRLTEMGHVSAGA